MQPNLKSHFAHLFFCIPLFLIFFVSSIKTSGQCIASSLSGNSFNTNDNSNAGSTEFTNAQNASTVGDGKAVASAVLRLNASTRTNYLKVTGFGFNIPSYATICGVTVTVHKRANAGIVNNLLGSTVTALDYSIKDYDVRLIKDGVITNTNKALSSEWPRTDSNVSYGNQTDLWDTNLTPEDVNSNNFGVAISAVLSVTNISVAGIVDVGAIDVKIQAEIDAVLITVHYSLPTVLPVTLYSFDAKLSNKTVQLNWSLAEQEENAFVTVQRSLNKSSWLDIYQHSLQNATSLLYYQFKDNLIESGDYSYRLKLTAATGKITFSPVRTVRFKNNSSLIVYPIPAQTRLSVSSSEKIKEITVTNLVQQQIKVPMNRLSGQTIELNIEQLPAGVYFVHTQKNVARFIKQ